MLSQWQKELIEASATGESVPLRVRLFRLFCLTVAVLCLAVILPMNLFQNLPKMVNVAVTFLGVFGGYCYWASRRGRHFFFGLFLALVGTLMAVWFLNGGAAGSISYYYFPLMLYPVAIFEGRLRLVLATSVVLNLCGLLVLEFLVPTLTTPFSNPSDQLIDLTTGALCSCLAVAAIARFILETYDGEHRRLSQARERLAASEQNYREIFNATSDALIILDATGRTIDVNERMCSLFGYDRETALCRSLDDLSLGVSPYSRKEAEAVLECALAKGPQLRIWRNRRSNGDVFWSEVGVRAGEIAGQKRLIISLRDIGDRIRAEEALRVQEERLRLSLEASNQGWFDIDVRSGAGRASAEYARIIGLPPEDFNVSADEWMGGVHPDDREAAERAFRSCLATAETHILEYRRRNASGDWKWIRSIGRIATFDSEGKPARMLGTHTDITERKVLEARVLHAQRLESVATLAAGVAHDLNNILTPMLMASGVLHDKVADPRDRELLASLESGARRGAMIVRQLMGFSQSLAENRVQVEIAPLLRETAQHWRASLPACVALTEQIPPGLWPVSADPEQLRQVLDNLCANAREAMPLGGTLTLSACNTQLTKSASTRNPWDRVGSFVMIAVADTGRGIPREVQPRIFDPFFTTKKVGEGSGLGLSTVHGIVNGHGGTVTVESEPGLGATFKVFIPARLDGNAVPAKSDGLGARKSAATIASTSGDPV